MSLKWYNINNVPQQTNPRTNLLSQSNTAPLSDKTHDIDVWQNKEMELRLGIPDLTKNKDDIDYIMKFMTNSFEDTRTTNFMNENRNRLWFWENVILIFSYGVIFEGPDKILFDEILTYFDQSNNAFIPNRHIVMNYKDTLIKKIETEYDIGNGNYRFMLIPFVITSNDEILKNAPEQVYRRYGPIGVFVEPEDVVNYMCEINYKYGAIPDDETMIKVLGESSKAEENNAKSSRMKVSIHGMDRPKNPTTTNPYLHSATQRLQRKGYIDPNTNDAFELINPEQQPRGPERQYFTPGELIHTKTGVKVESDECYYRKPVKTIRRETLVDLGNEYGHTPNRSYGNRGLYSQIKGNKIIGPLHVDDEVKGVSLKVNSMYETLQNQTEKPSYQLYDTPDDEQIKQESMDDFAQSIQVQRFADSVKARADGVIWKQQNSTTLTPKQSGRPAEESGIFAIKGNHL